MKIAIILFSLLCAGCSEKPEPPTMLLNETATGCLFIGHVRGDRSSILQWLPELRPLIGADGKQICNQVKP